MQKQNKTKQKTNKKQTNKNRTNKKPPKQTKQNQNKTKPDNDKKQNVFSLICKSRNVFLDFKIKTREILKMAQCVIKMQFSLKIK